jgi:hypothetical protein
MVKIKVCERGFENTIGALHDEDDFTEIGYSSA